MAKVIASVKLAPGNVAFYDEYSKIHLTLSNPIAQVYEGMDLRRIRASVRSGTLRVLSGSLTEPVVTEVNVLTPTVKVAELTKKQDEPIIETPVAIHVDHKEEPIIETLTESVQEDSIVAEEVIEKKPSSKRSKKSAPKEDIVSDPEVDSDK